MSGPLRQLDRGNVLRFPKAPVVPAAQIANGLRRVADGFRGLHYRAGAGEPLSEHMATADRHMRDLILRRDPEIPLDYDPARQHLSISLPDAPYQTVHVIARGNAGYQVTLSERFATEGYPYIEMARERCVHVNADSLPLTAVQTGLNEFFLQVTASEALMRGLFDAMGKISEHSLAARAYVSAQFLLALYETPDQQGDVRIAVERESGKFIALKRDVLANPTAAMAMIKSIITPRAGGFELSFGSTQKPPFQARLFFTGQKDDRDANLLLLLLEDPTLQEPALLRTGLRHLFERTEIFVRQHEAQMEGYDTSTARRQP